MPNRFSFLECTNPLCRFRFPLDLSEFQGKICPRCGSNLGFASPQTEQYIPEPLKKPGFYIEAVLDNIRSAHNVGSIFRTAEGAGIEHLYLCGLTPNPESNPALTKAALGAEKRVGWTDETNAVALIVRLKQTGSQIIALECTPGAENIFSHRPITSNKVVMVVGSEPAGVDPEVLNLADNILYIPMFGEKSSLNVSVAFGIAAYTLLASSGEV